VAKSLHLVRIPYQSGKKSMTRRYFTEAEVQTLVGKRVKRDEVIGEVKGYEYIADIGEEEEPYSAYSLLILWEGGTTEKVDKAAYRQGVEELE
jgi:hypothetical protein